MLVLIPSVAGGITRHTAGLREAAWAFSPDVIGLVVAVWHSPST